MNPFKKSDSKEVRVISPPNYGVLEKDLSDKEMNFLWRCIDNRGQSTKGKLIGQIHESNDLSDRGDWFYINTLQIYHPVIYIYMIYIYIYIYIIYIYLHMYVLRHYR